MAQAVHDEPETAPQVHEAAHEEHGHAGDPNAAPMRHDIQEYFTAGQVAFVSILAAVAIVGGLVAGIVLAND